LIRAEQGAAREEDVGRDYGVGKVGNLLEKWGFKIKIIINMIPIINYLKKLNIN
jgi:hypothetical protein